MPTRRQLQFLASIAVAAREAPLPRGRPITSNLTAQGRRKGLEAMRKAPRCGSITKAGQKCKNAAMRGSTRCLKHGGRVEVPNHPHNIKRFMCGKMQEAMANQEAYLENMQFWEGLTANEKAEMREIISEALQANGREFLSAVRQLKEVEDKPYKIWKRVIDNLRAGNLSSA